MPQLRDVHHLVREGRFLEAQEALERTHVAKAERVQADVLRAELLERTGNYSEARAAAERLLKGSLAASHRSACELILGLVDWDAGATHEGLKHLQRAVSLANSVRDTARLCWAQLRLLVNLAGRANPESVAALLAQTRWNAIRLGDPRLTAALHVFTGEVEAKRGLTDVALRHTQLAERLLVDFPNFWLQSVAENNHVALALMSSDFEHGILHAEEAKRLAEVSGAAAMLRASLGNLGNLYSLVGLFQKAIPYLERAAGLLPSTGEYANAPIDSLAQAYVMMGDLERANILLDRIEKTIRTPEDRTLYANRYAALTRTIALAIAGRVNEALISVDQVLSLSELVSDRLLRFVAIVRKAELKSSIGDAGEAMRLLGDLLGETRRVPPNIIAQYERALALALFRSGALHAAVGHLERSSEIYVRLGCAPDLQDLTRAWKEAGGPEAFENSLTESDDAAHRCTALLKNVAALIRYGRFPELAATRIVAIVGQARIAQRAQAKSTTTHGATVILKSHDLGVPVDCTEERIDIGSRNGQEVNVFINVRREADCMAAFDAIRLIVDAVQDLDRARAEREAHMTLWPLDELPVDGQPAIVRGKLREIMTSAQKIARADVTVLITGESGTGKDILARAIHASSRRADRPFVPFNCTAVPRDLLESQLFGYRRGSFTGADRDHPGLIRAAEHGTLFLDEIGELGLDLQPKLLRFLESGEIAPLGEPAPLRADVRILAATNANLEQLVQDGRFREDLYYRLNVIRLMVPPLRERRDEIPELAHHFVAAAAREFDKGTLRIAEETMEDLLLYSWPGNVRQLQNELRRMVAMADPNDILRPSALSPDLRRALPKPTRTSTRGAAATEVTVRLADRLAPTIAYVEREMISAALRAFPGRMDAAAKSLGISRKGLYLKRQRLGL